MQDAQAREDMAKHFDDGVTALAPKHRRSKKGGGRNAEDDRTWHTSSTKSSIPSGRVASGQIQLSVPIDKYLLREVTAQQAGFLETRDKCSAEAAAREQALKRAEERAAAGRAEDRRQARARALAAAREATGRASAPLGSLGLARAAAQSAPRTVAMTAIFGSTTERRRTAAALAVASSGRDEQNLRRSATQSALLCPRRGAPPAAAGGATRVHKIEAELAELRTYGRLKGAKSRAVLPAGKGPRANHADDDGSQFGGGGSVLLGVGDARRRRATRDRRFNEPTDLPPGESTIRFREDPPRQALAPLDKVHDEWSWAFRPPDEANKVSEDTRNDLSRLQAIVGETEEACNLQQRPLNPVLEVREEVTW